MLVPAAEERIQAPAAIFQPRAGLFTGSLRHRRFRPRKHQFEYSMFLAFLDVDRIPEQMAATPYTRYNRFAWASFHDQDHFGDPALPLRERLRQSARQNGLELPDGPIFLLTHLRYLGYCFNPISIFYCYERDGRLGLTLAEVNSTFGESHNYWLHAGNASGREGGSRRYVTPKKMHVSPFFGMNMNYEFVLTDPGERLIAHMNVVEPDGCFFDATLRLERADWNGGNLLKALARHPWMTAKVTAGIHWQALQLFLKKVPVHRHPGSQNPG
ncbi:MAG: DUF1365 domain-containing protein [Bryobacteraceae bacterium]|nr:DUF1365 domain-containing protein [Bryobacteraceae bacterium]